LVGRGVKVGRVVAHPNLAPASIERAQHILIWDGLRWGIEALVLDHRAVRLALRRAQRVGELHVRREDAAALVPIPAWEAKQHREARDACVLVPAVLHASLKWHDVDERSVRPRAAQRAQAKDKVSAVEV